MTKSELLLLAATAVFAALMLAVHFTDDSVGPRDAYSVTTSRSAEESGEQERINVNTADEAALQTVPGIGPALAKRIVDERTANGPFASVDELTRVSGIGENTVEALRPYVTVQSTGEEDGT